MAPKMKFKCPVCHHEIERQFDIAINTRLNPDLKEKLLDGTLLLFECEHCGAKRHISSQFLYHDPDKKLLFHVAPQYNEQREAIQAQLNDLINSFPVSVDDYEMRIMLNMADLMEKVQIYDSGFKDTEIEMVKMLTDGLFAKENPTAQVKNRYFFLNKEGQPKFLYVTDTNQMMVDCHQRLLTFIRDKFKRALKQNTKGHFRIINHAWAENILQNKETEAFILPED